MYITISVVWIQSILLRVRIISIIGNDSAEHFPGPLAVAHIVTYIIAVHLSILLVKSSDNGRDEDSEDSKES